MGLSLAGHVTVVCYVIVDTLMRTHRCLPIPNDTFILYSVPELGAELEEILMQHF